DNPFYNIARDSSSIPFYNILNCAGNEVNINTCPNRLLDCPSRSAVALTCQKGSTLSGFSVYVSDTEDWRSGTLCYQHDIQQVPPNEVTLDCVTSGRYVTVDNTRNTTIYPNVSEFSYINICEIKGNGCDVGFFGENCTRCPQNCLNNTCQFQFGICYDCNNGYTGQYCEIECDQGFYGLKCNMTCSEFCRGRVCNPTTGQCYGCVDGRSGFFCEIAVPVDNSDDSGASTEGNTWTTAPLIAVALLSVAVILLITILFVIFLRKKHQSSKPSNNNPDYELAISRKDKNEYTGIHAAKSPEYPEVETSHYMEIGNSDIKTRTEYMNLDQL
ncbi:cell death abnormality protein 1-like, partial [Saccostrea cucullata]|uniref:cell death abnormality protein 1-like n=1 Tax=Saccostrea cuccullata TaxID=36930 RepID=UPI002ED57352